MCLPPEVPGRKTRRNTLFPLNVTLRAPKGADSSKNEYVVSGIYEEYITVAVSMVENIGNECYDVRETMLRPLPTFAC